jgi:peptidoglycan/xylan/chitin deacetylase (PgdA/CDA1 family)
LNRRLTRSQRITLPQTAVLGILTAIVIVLALVDVRNQDQSDSGRIVWLPGMPSTITDSSQKAETPAPTTVPVTATLPPASTAAELSPAQRVALKPNELGGIPVLMYHVISPDPPAVDDGYTRSVAAFKSDLQELYDRNYFVVALADVVEDRINAPAGKHPVALTFDDGTAGQFRYLVAEDGNVSIDPESAVGILESFFVAHPDFGRGGYFAVPSTMCFDWQGTETEPDQTPFCAQKLKWLIDHGYEVGDHTVEHEDLLDLDDDAFEAAVGGGWVGLQTIVPELVPSILAMPFGNYPDQDLHPEQREWMRSGFVYDGVEIRLQAALMVGANPAASPASTEWDQLYVARIRAYDGELGSTEWLNTLSSDPSLVYTSDGNPDTITVPSQLPLSLEGTIDKSRLEQEGKQVIRYDPLTGVAP